MFISVEKVSRPEILLNALKSSVVVAQIHRAKSGWDYKAVQSAMANLSAMTFQLYIYLEGGAADVPWSVWPSKVEKVTQLDEFTLQLAVMELKKKGFLTPGKIEMDGELYAENVYHFWERPELCDIEDDAA